MRKYKISIIIPVYNVEKYVIECLDSIDFNNQDWQVVLVNDGSTDSSYDLIKEYEKYENVKIISQENAGLSVARNTGISNADGDYVMFLDSDDMLSDRFQNIIDESANLDGTVYFWASVLKYDDRIIYDELVFKKLKSNRISSDEIRKFFCRNSISYVAWRYLLPRRVAKTIGFEKGVCNEDELFTTKLLSMDNKYEYVPSVNYIYRRVRIGSITSKVTIKHYESTVKILKLLSEMDENNVVRSQKGKLTLSLISRYPKVWREVQNLEELILIVMANKKYISNTKFTHILLKLSLCFLGVKKTLKLLRRYEKN